MFMLVALFNCVNRSTSSVVKKVCHLLAVLLNKLLIFLVDGNERKCAFSFFEFWNICLNFAVDYNGNPATVSVDGV